MAGVFVVKADTQGLIDDLLGNLRLGEESHLTVRISTGGDVAGSHKGNLTVIHLLGFLDLVVGIV